MKIIREVYYLLLAHKQQVELDMMAQRTLEVAVLDMA